MTQDPYGADRCEDGVGTVIPSVSYPKVRQVWSITGLMILTFLAIGTAGQILFGTCAVVLAEVAIVVPVVIFLRITGFSHREVFRLNPIDWRLAMLGILIGVSLSVATSAVDTVFGSLFPMPEEMRHTLRELLIIDSLNELIVAGCGLVLAAAVCEELFFRGFLQATLEQRQGPLRAVVLSSLVFGIVHFNPWWFPSILFAGVIFGMLAYASGSVYPGIIAHAVHNGLALLVINADRFEFLNGFGAPETVSFPAAMASIFALTASLAWLLRRKPTHGKMTPAMGGVDLSTTVYGRD